MADPERILVEAVDLVRRLADDGSQLARRRRKLRKRRMRRILRGVILLVVATFVIIPSMIAAGFLFGPRGVEGLIAAPLLLLATWSAILYWTFKRGETKPEALKKSELAQLPAQTGDFLEQERRRLPWPAQQKMDAIATRLDSLGPQLAGLSDQSEGASELRRLLGEELPELVRSYRKLPANMTQKPLYGGLTPEKQLVDGLATIDAQLGRLHERLAQNDLHALATHQRYLELKYKREDEGK